KDGDMIEYSIPDRFLKVDLSDDELASRRQQWKPTHSDIASSWLRRYRKLATNASTGAILSKD
ncbi:MAG: dihydroxy-acid dehydratase, partial [Akkermansia sp.]